MFLEKINQMDKPLATLTKEKRASKSIKLNEKGDTTRDTQRIISGYYEQLHINKPDSLKEMETFLETTYQYQIRKK